MSNHTFQVFYQLRGVYMYVHIIQAIPFIIIYCASVFLPFENGAYARDVSIKVLSGGSIFSSDQDRGISIWLCSVEFLVMDGRFQNRFLKSSLIYRLFK